MNAKLPRRWIAVCLVLTCLLASWPAIAGVEQRQDAEGRDYWLYTPDRMPRGEAVWLVIGVHGYRGNGQGAGGLRGWANEYGCIIVGPTYDSNGYQYLDAGADDQTLDLIAALREEFELHEKIFVAGFSGGAQFSHRFAMRHPDLVVGCAAHSAGTWGSGDYDPHEPNPEATGVLFVISCGEEDTTKMAEDVPFDRLAWAQRYARLLEEGGYTYDARWWPNTGHQQSQGARDMTRDCFLAATQLKPGYDTALAEILEAIDAEQFGEAWQTISQQRRVRRPRARDGIIARVYVSHMEQLEALAAQVDAAGIARVQAVLDAEGDPDEGIAELRSIQREFRDAPETRAAVRDAMRELQRRKREAAAE